MVSEEEIRVKLKEVKDPELHIDIMSLGLIYGIQVSEATGQVNVVMTLTSPACPAGDYLISGVQSALAVLEGVKDVQVELTFDPPWDPRERCSDEAKDMLGIF